jgi:hypothetical protein
MALEVGHAATVEHRCLAHRKLCLETDLLSEANEADSQCKAYQKLDALIRSQCDDIIM